MTALLATPTGDVTAGNVRRRPFTGPLLLATYILGLAATLASFHGAAHGSPRGDVFALFWLGVLPPFLITAVSVARKPTPARTTVALSALAAFGTLPKLFRTPSGPLYFDELAHWRQADDLAITGVVGAQNTMVKAIPDFPGLHDLTASLTQATGLSTWSVAVAVVIACHVLGLLGVFTLVTTVLRRVQTLSPDRALRIAGIAAVIYATNSSWMFFDTQFAYETLAVPLVIWAFVFSFAASQVRGARRVGALSGAAALALAAGITHHASAIILVGGLFVLVLITAVRSRSRAVLPVLGAAVLCSVGVGVWLSRSWSLLVGYLGPNFTGAWAQLTGLFGHPAVTAATSGSRSTHHGLFAGSTLPAYEIACSLATPLLLCAVVGTAVARTLRARFTKTPKPADTLGLWSTTESALLSVMAAAYFLSLPLLVTGAGNEVARRSWAYTWIGVGFVVAVFADTWLERRRVGTRRAQRGASVSKRAVVLLGLLSVITVGNVAGGQDEAYRMPGPYAVGSDTRGVDAELLGVASWMRSAVPAHSWVTTDRFTSAVLSSYGRQNSVTPWAHMPLWNLVTTEKLPDDVLQGLRSAQVVYAIVDDRMATSQSQSGFWYDKNEPAHVDNQPTPVPALRRLDCLPWSVPVFASEHYTIYRLDMSKYDAATEARVVALLTARAGATVSNANGKWQAPTTSALTALTSRSCS